MCKCSFFINYKKKKLISKTCNDVLINITFILLEFIKVSHCHQYPGISSKIK